MLLTTLHGVTLPVPTPIWELAPAPSGANHLDLTYQRDSNTLYLGHICVATKADSGAANGRRYFWTMRAPRNHRVGSRPLACGLAC